MKFKYVVTLKAVGNPDHGESPARLPGVPQKTVGVDSFEAAQERCREYIQNFALGAGNWAGGQVYLNTGKGSVSGEVLAHISYNGRLWPVEAKKESVG